jgi:hypothetical protein
MRFTSLPSATSSSPPSLDLIIIRVVGCSICGGALHSAQDKYGNRDIAAKVKAGWQNFFWTRINKIVGYHPADLGAHGSDDDDA